MRNRLKFKKIINIRPNSMTGWQGLANCLSPNNVLHTVPIPVVATPSSTKRFFKCSIIRDVTPKASVVLVVVHHAGPLGPASHNSNANELCDNR